MKFSKDDDEFIPNSDDEREYEREMMYDEKIEKKNKKKRKRKELKQKHRSNLKKVNTLSQEYKYGGIIGEISAFNRGLIERKITKSKKYKSRLNDLTKKSIDFSNKKSIGMEKKKKKDKFTFNTSHPIISSLLVKNLPLNEKNKNFHGINFPNGYVNLPTKNRKEDTNIRFKPKEKISSRLKESVVNMGSKTAYSPTHNFISMNKNKDNKKRGDLLQQLEMNRLPENSLSMIQRNYLVKNKLMKQKDAFNPIGKYSLAEMPDALDNKKNTQDFQQLNRGNVYKEFKKILGTKGENKKIGKKVKHRPQSTPKEYINALDKFEKTNDPKDKEALRKQDFRTQRAFYEMDISSSDSEDEKKEKK